MDGNKDEALKCLKIGQEALEIGDKIRALKFLTKARRLDPALPVEDIISSIDTKSSANPPHRPSSGTAPSEASASSKLSGGASARARVSANGSSAAAAGSSNAYTEEQISIVRQIRKKKDYYEILGLEKGCSVEDVRKAYRKLSLKVHPDKNTAPGAEEAFKAVSKAFQCLSDEEGRKRYDLVGSEEEVVYHRQSRGAHHGFNGYFEEEFDPNEIFRDFFFSGGGMPGTAASFNGFRFGTGMGPSRAQHADGHGSGNANIRMLIQILPVILLLLLNFLPSSEPVHAFSRTHSYQHQVVTESGVLFYVKTSKFEEEYPRHSAERVALERRVEKDYFVLLSHNCRYELQRQHWGLMHHTPNCDMLREFQAKGNVGVS